jgi:hypothetical protein
LREEQLITVLATPSTVRILPSRRMNNSFGSVDAKAVQMEFSEFVSDGFRTIIEMFETGF